MMGCIEFLLIFLFIQSSIGSGGGGGAIHTKLVYTSEAFYMSINNDLFNNSEFIIGSPIKYRAAVYGMPDPPSWMTCIYNDVSHSGYLYGVPDKPGEVVIEVVATNEYTFQTDSRVMKFIIMERKEHAKYQVQVRFYDLDVEDMFIGDKANKLLEIFKRRLWKNSRQLYVTMIDSAIRQGSRKPLNPNEKDGVVVRIGSSDDFSRELDNLEREVIPLRNREPCPKDFKRTSFERFFREEYFIPDWCGFKLLSVQASVGKVGSKEPTYQPIHLSSDVFNPPYRNMPGRSLLVDFLLCIILPTALAIFLTIALSFIMFGRREGVDKRNRETPSVQMVQYASIHRASNNLRALAKRDGATTPCSTLPRSYTSGSTNMVYHKDVSPRYGVEI